MNVYLRIKKQRRGALMECKRGIAMVLRGDEPLGNVEYEFAIHDNGRVIGGIIDMALTDPHPRAPRVSARLLPQSIVAPDLHLSLGDGTAVAFLVEHSDGFIANGRRYKEKD